MTERLPIYEIQDEFLASLKKGPLVITAPTGSGKSTELPRWSQSLGRVLVIEPRRVACRGLAARVAELEGCELGGPVGYAVRDDARFSQNSDIVYATPGVVLRFFLDGKIDAFDVVILDEFHERSLDVDLLLALLKKRFKGHLVVTSATLDARRLSDFLDATHLHAPGTVHPVEVHHIEGRDVLPDVRGLEKRLDTALSRMEQLDGDVLVFLPGKAEIQRVADHLRARNQFEILQIHGGLTLKEQSAVFASSPRRRIILATNVAETSITIPGVRAVIDSGLVRRTRYFNGRGYLSLVPIAQDSATQRTGRAGRTGPGMCFRLWSGRGRLEAQTPPEVYRESISPLVLAAAACGETLDGLTFLDPPKSYAVETAVADLQALDALQPDATLSSRGRVLFTLPMDAPLGALLVEAQKRGCLEDAIDLVSVLSVGRPLFAGDRRPEDPKDDLRMGGCDAQASILAVRMGNPKVHRINPFVLGEARTIARRLRGAFGLPAKSAADAPVDRKTLLPAAMASDPRCVFVARHRKGRVFFGNGGPEVELTRESAVETDKVKAIVVFATMAMGMGLRDTRILATCATPVTLGAMAAQDLGALQVASVKLDKGRVVSVIERVYAGQVLETQELAPEGALARDSIRELFLRGTIFKGVARQSRDHLEGAGLFQRVRRAGLSDVELDGGAWEESAVPELAPWVDRRLLDLGVESGEDLALLSEADLQAPALPPSTLEWLNKRFPRTVNVGDALYLVEYDLMRKEVTLVKKSGNRKGPPSLDTVPGFRGFKIKVKHVSRAWVLREAR